ncbi:MAG TPA: hypothetical protein VGM19_03630 [Armatimonadota bacterium]|jgi:hypothetical protein
MDHRVQEFVADTVRNVVGLDVALFFQANPAAFDTPAGLALRLHRRVEEIQPALDRLTASQVLEVFSRGDGRYHCYCLRRDREAWNLLCLVSHEYLDVPDSRKEIVRMLVRQQAADRSGGTPPEN